MFFKGIMINGHEAVWSGNEKKDAFISNYIEQTLPLIEKNTFVKAKGPEEKIIHYFFEKNELEIELEKYFEIKEIKETKPNMFFVYCINKK